MEPGSQLILEVAGEDLNGKAYNKIVMLAVGDEGSGADRLNGIGLETRTEADKILIDNVVFASAAEKAGIDFDQEILSIKMPTQRLPKQLMFIPALVLLVLVWFMQRNRKRKFEAAAA
jgi:predicted metalloprotease with PDZ domain